MGYMIRLSTNGQEIQCYLPDDSLTSFYLRSPADMSTILIMARQHFQYENDITLDMLRIDAEYIHTDYVGYDRYDPDDYTLYLCISKL